MAYTSLTDLKSYLGISVATDDALLSRLITYAQKMIDQDRLRAFEAVTETRYYRYENVRGQVLYLDGDLLTVTALLNGDSVATPITNTHYWLVPRNASPKYAIRLKSDSYWEQDVDYEISVTGTWGYTATCPPDISQACTRLAAFLYRQKDAQVFDVTATPELGVITIPQGFPADARQILDRYPRRDGMA